MIRAPSILRPLSVLLVAALIFGTLMGAIAPIFAADPSHTYYVAQSGTADEGNGTSCDAPDYVGTTDVAIQDAIDNLAVADGDTIVICAGTYDIGTTLDLAGKLVSLQGAGAGITVLDGGNTFVGSESSNNGHRIIMSIDDIRLSGMTLQHGYSAGDGGAVNSSRDVYLSNCIFRDNLSGWNGGAIGGALSVDSQSCQFANNTSGMFGGAIDSPVATAASSSFVSNIAGQKGGAINTSNFITSASIFDANEVQQSGGAIYTSVGDSFATTFINNSAGLAGGTGGALWGGVLTVAASNFDHNRGVTGGGAVHGGHGAA